MKLDDCYRPISDISEQELTGLIGNQEENQWIEFKRTDEKLTKRVEQEIRRIK